MHPIPYSLLPIPFLPVLHQIKFSFSAPITEWKGLLVACRTELLEAAIESLNEGVALADSEGRAIVWNGAAEHITGYTSAEIVGHGVRELLDQLVAGGSSHWIVQSECEQAARHGFLVNTRDKVGDQIPVVAQVIVLRDALGGRIGTGVLFHPAERIDGLPQGNGVESRVHDSVADIEERLSAMHEDFVRGGSPFGVLWITVDQAPGLRRSHGTRAFEAMLEKVEKTLANGLKPAEEIWRWGENDFLALSHERSAAALAAHAQTLAGLARTTDFRWWGDRISLSVSIGAAQAERGECVSRLLERAEAAVIASVHAGGNHITGAQGKA